MEQKCSSRQSHSDYCSNGSTYSSDEESTSSLLELRQMMPAGVCPHCDRIFEQPVTLQCGHSLCRKCCQTILNNTTHHTQRSRPRMGVNSIQLRANTNQQVLIRSPKCIVCHNPASSMAPIPNHDLSDILRSMKAFKWNQTPSIGPSPPINSKVHLWTSDDRSRINECKIAVLGDQRVGKTCFVRVQYGNELMFPDLINMDEESDDTYVLDLVDDMDLEKVYTSAHGIVLMYSVENRASFYHAAEVYKKLEMKREHNQPIILVGSKKDRERRRQVDSFQGQQLARSIGCPFIEVSSKTNDCVNQVFIELVTMIQKQQNSFKEVVETTLNHENPLQLLQLESF